MRKISKLVVAKVIKIILSFVESVTNCWVTYTLRPRRSINFGHVPDPTAKNVNEEVAIVMQGPVMTKWDFTLETIKMYKLMYPGTFIIVSTWCDTHDEVISRLKDLGVHVILSEYPDNSGISHINYQIVSTNAGIRKAQQLGTLYCLKTRTDQRMYRHDAIECLLAMNLTFPLKKGSQLCGRLITLSMNTFKYRPYSLSDMFLFGFTDDVKLYWDVPLETRTDYSGRSTLLSFSKARVCEVYLCTHFVERNGDKLQWTVDHSWEIYLKYFCVLDTEMVDLYWPKYNRFLAARWLDYSARRGMEEYRFNDWFRGHAKFLSSQNAPEEILNRYGNDSLNDILANPGQAGKKIKL